MGGGAWAYLLWCFSPLENFGKKEMQECLGNVLKRRDSALKAILIL
jgi:hypothetical protein